MNDEPLDDEENDTHIRALLAELGSGPDGEPMPAEVAARLDDTLARLVAERTLSGPEDSEEEGSGTVVPLRRRWLPRATAAAAAIVVLGAGGVAATQLGVFGHDSLTTADNAGSSSAAGSETAPDPEATSPSPSGGDTGGFQATALPRLSSVSFAADVGRLLSSRRAQLSTPEKAAVPSTNDAAKSPSDDTTAGKSSDALRSPACPGPRITDGAAPSPVRFDGQRAVLLVHPARNGHQLVEAWDCSGRRRLADTTLTP